MTPSDDRSPVEPGDEALRAALRWGPDEPPTRKAPDWADVVARAGTGPDAVDPPVRGGHGLARGATLAARARALARSRWAGWMSGALACGLLVALAMPMLRMRTDADTAGWRGSGPDDAHAVWVSLDPKTDAAALASTLTADGAQVKLSARPPDWLLQIHVDPKDVSASSRINARLLPYETSLDAAGGARLRVTPRR